MTEILKKIVLIIAVPIVMFIAILLWDLFVEWLNKDHPGSIFYKQKSIKNDKRIKKEVLNGRTRQKNS